MDSGGIGHEGSGRGAAWTKAQGVQTARERQAHRLPRTHIHPSHNSIGEAADSSPAGQ